MSSNIKSTKNQKHVSGIQSPEKKTVKADAAKKPKGPCTRLCTLIPTNVPLAGEARPVLHPKKDVFVFKVAKVGADGGRRCKMELELVTPKGPERKPLTRIDTRETQCDPEPVPCMCCTSKPCRKQK